MNLQAWLSLVFLVTILAALRAAFNAQLLKHSAPPARWWEPLLLVTTAPTLTISPPPQLVLSARPTFRTASLVFRMDLEELNVLHVPPLITHLMTILALSVPLLYQTVILVSKTAGGQPLA